MLINLSNHPSLLWSERQLDAAKGYGDIIDVPFPVIDEKGDEKYISDLADEYLRRVLTLSVNNEVVVHLMGELSFTFALLNRLQANGIKCIASTSERIVLDECAGHKGEVIFRFERFREYERR
ncbi:MAG: CRISPR-associated protein [Marinifilaceae bacterium]|nr:CRISPR-associated protein [Marinifilaceae bacterium]